MVIASQVPTGSMGTSPLPDVQSDRFMFCAWSGYPSPEEEDAVLQNIDRISDASVQPVVSLAEIQTLQNAARAVTVSDAVRRYIIAIVGYFRQHPDILAGPSIRGSLALYRGSRAAALTRRQGLCHSGRCQKAGRTCPAPPPAPEGRGRNG